MVNLVMASDSRLAQFSRDISAWHGYVSFLGLPSLQPNADIGIDELYVPHYVSRKRISSDERPETWDVQDPVGVLSESRRMIVLGDPGSGKSTLVSWLAWYLASGFAQRLPGDLDGLLPIPIVLRDMPSGSSSSFDELINAFCALPIAENLDRKVLDEYISAGRCIFLVDGLDEIPKSMGAEIQSILVNDVAPNYWLATSRIVGFTRELEGVNSSSSIASVKNDPLRAKSSGEPIFYIAPFNDEQISKFTANWYREQGGRASEQLSYDFLTAINSDKSIKSLARTPNLLTMMAQIFRVRARLPNGRALLYDDIAQAYLESIDTARKMKDEFSWKTKRRWLAKIAFEMQMMRSTDDGSSKPSDKELLVDREHILRWLNEAMVETDRIRDENYASRYLDWIARRSGLLLPRGEGKYAFLHLSFQEYFAARYVKAQLEHPRWPAISDIRVSKKSLRVWFDSDRWGQVFVFVFELFSGSPGWAENLISTIIPNLTREAGQKRMNKRKRVNPSDKLLVDLLINPHAGISEELRAQCMDHLVAIVLLEQVAVSHGLINSYFTPELEKPLFVKLLESPLTQGVALGWLVDVQSELAHLALDNLGSDTWGVVEPILREMQGLKFLSLSFVPIEDCSIISHMTDLEALSLRGTQISSIDELASLSKLTVISLDRTPIRNAQVIEKMLALEVLDLDFTEISDIDFIKGLGRLRKLSLCGAKVRDVSALANVSTLTHFGISYTEIVDLEGLSSSVGSLSYLDVSESKVCDLGFMRGSSALTACFIDGSRVTSLDFLYGCKNLRTLWIDRCDIYDITPLSRCVKIRLLKMSGTRVSDIGVLSKMKQLSRLALDGTLVKDLSPLENLKELTLVSVVGCNVDNFGSLDDSVIYAG